MARADATARMPIEVPAGALWLTAVIALISSLVVLFGSYLSFLFPLVLVILGFAYSALSLRKSLWALVILLLVFINVLGLLAEDNQVGPLKPLDILLAVAAVPLLLHWGRRGFPYDGPVRARLSLATGLILSLAAFEVILTTLRTGQSLWDGIKSGKSILFYGAFLLIPVYAGSEQKIQRLLRWMTILACGLALVYVLASLLGEISWAPGLVLAQTTFIGIGTFTRVRNRGAPFIVAMLLYHFYRMTEGKSALLQKVGFVLLFLGALIHFFRSLWIGILGGVVLQACVEGRRGARNVVKLLVVVFLLYAGIGTLYPDYVKMIMSRAASTMTEVQDLTGSYGVRYERIQSWMPILRQNWVLGIGFVHGDSTVGQQIEALNGLPATGDYEVGWIDLLGRMGVAGTAVFLFALFQLSRSVWAPGSYEGAHIKTRLRRTIFAYIVAGIISLPGYPLLTWEGGVIPLAFLTGILGTLEQFGQSGEGKQA